MIKVTVLITAAALAALRTGAAFKPNSFRLSRRVTLAAPPEKVFALINDLRQFSTWNPFAKMDTRNGITCAATALGVGVGVGVGGTCICKGERPGPRTAPSARGSSPAPHHPRSQAC